MARDVFQRLKTDGQYARGWLGVQLDRVSAEQAEQLGMPNTNGALVMAVVADSPAENADVRAGDVVLQWNGKQVRDPSHLSALVAETEPESTVKMLVLRDGESLELDVRVGRLLPEMLSRR
jgi:serine protease Do